MSSWYLTTNDPHYHTHARTHSKAQEKRGLMVEIDKYKNANALSKMAQASAEQQLLALEDDRAQMQERSVEANAKQKHDKTKKQ